MTQVGAAILIGGKSSRFGSDKGLFPLHGRPLARWVYDAIAGDFSPILVSYRTKGQHAAYREILPPTVMFLQDRVHDHLEDSTHAPLIGMQLSLASAPTGVSHLLILSCDLPFVQPPVLRYLAQQAPGHDVVIPRWANGYVEPLCAVYSTGTALVAIEDRLSAGDLKILNSINLLDRIQYVSVEQEIQPFDPQLRSFKNVNTMADLNDLASI